MKRKAPCLLVALLCLSLLGAGCSGDTGGARRAGRLQVVATIFPLAEFARNIAGDRADVFLLLPAGVEPHAYEPTPRDMTRVREADLFLSVGSTMEPWAAGLLKDRRQDRPSIAAGSAVKGNPGAVDPHLWLDFSYAEQMLAAVLDGFIRLDPSSADFYRRNADAYRGKLRDLDARFRSALSGCRKKTIVSGGHAAFGHLARRYGLGYVTAYGQSPNADPSPRELARISALIRKDGLKFIFHEELLEPRISRTLAQETGAELLLLHAGHNLSREELDSGATFIGIMQQNLANLEKGLECRNR
ncbi:MAG: metal ABC transporter substrate-binding protein [Thermodesulfovibrionales bacterium]